MKVSVRVNSPRARQMMAEAAAKIRRARKRDRPALKVQWARAIVRDCVHVSTYTPPPPGSPPMLWGRPVEIVDEPRGDALSAMFGESCK